MTELAILITNLGLSTAIAAIFVWAATRREARSAAEQSATDIWIRTELATALRSNSALLAQVATLLAETRNATMTAALAVERLATLIGTGKCPLDPTNRP